MDIKLKLFNICPAFLKRNILQRMKMKKAGSESKLLRRIYSKNYNIEIGYGTYGGIFNVGNIPSGVKIGNYCSVADGVRIFRANHPAKMFTTHPIFYNPIMGIVEQDKLERPEISIGHDVWIGANVIILPSVNNIGNGSIIGAGSIVTKDVPPYAVVAGNPAKVIKMRFNPSQIQYLEEIQWWNCSMDELSSRFAEIQAKLDNLA